MTSRLNDGLDVPFEPLFQALRHYGVHPTLAQMRQFSAVLAHEAAWDWDKIETVALAIFGSTKADIQAVHEAIRVVRDTASPPPRVRATTERRERTRPDAERRSGAGEPPSAAPGAGGRVSRARPGRT